jgi:hypothetical protein
MFIHSRVHSIFAGKSMPFLQSLPTGSDCSHAAMQGMLQLCLYNHEWMGFLMLLMKIELPQTDKSELALIHITDVDKPSN